MSALIIETNTEASNLKEEFLKIRSNTSLIVQPLETEDYVPQATLFTSPPKWHLAHTTWFFEEMILSKYKPDYKSFNEKFGFLFNSYYESIGDRVARDKRGLLTRPSVKEVFEYREYVDQQMIEFITTNLDNKVSALIQLGLQHEQQHQELLLTDIKYLLSQNPIYPVYQKENNIESDQNKDKDWVTISEGIYEIGHQGNGFCFDNELGRHKVYLSSFQISKALITNGEYLEFIKDGGYNNFAFWLEEGWAWLKKHAIRKPLYWEQKGQDWYQFTLSGLQPLELDDILVHISFYEAAAFANWRGCRLPTEFEWEVGARNFDWGKRWEWTNSAYLPYPGFKTDPGAVGEYNGKFMVNQMVLRGASVATPKNHARITYRNFFHPIYQWQFSGIRLAK